MDHVFTEEIWAHCNESNAVQVAALGFVQGTHHRGTHCDGFHTQLHHDAIQHETTKTKHLNIQQRALPPSSKMSDTEEGEIIQPKIKLEVEGCENGNSCIKTEAL